MTPLWSGEWLESELSSAANDAALSPLSTEPSEWIEARARPTSVLPRDQKLCQWMVRIVGRDEFALTSLHGACASRIHFIVQRIVHDKHLADEVVADCFWQVWRNAAGFDPARGSTMGWISSIARSRAIDAMRRRSAYAKHELPLDDDATDESPAFAESPCDLANDRQRDRLLHKLLQSIEPVQRQLLYLAFVAGMSHPEIATHCGLALGTVKSHIRRGLAALRSSCEKLGLQA